MVTQSAGHQVVQLVLKEVKNQHHMLQEQQQNKQEKQPMIWECAKVAVYSHNPRIDPIGCCVGVKGVRINAVSKELANENIDCVEYHNSLEIFVAKALTPAQILSVKIQEPQKDDKNIESTQDSKENQNNEKAPETKRKKAIAQIKTDQKSKAIGKNGVNIRLASMLCECDIELQEITESKPTESEKVGIDALSSLFKS